MLNIYKILEEQRAKGMPCALCMIVSSQGSTPLKAGAKMLVTGDGKLFGTIGGGNFEKKVIENALQVINKNESKLFQHNLLQQHGMCCGGSVDVFIESIMPNEKLFVFGAGHVGRALSNYAASLSFDVFLIDNRKEEFDRLQNSAVNKLQMAYDVVLPGLPFDKHSYIAIMTYDHRIDREILAYCLKKPFAYLGMIGSQRKVEITRKMFLNSQLCTDEEISKVDMPMGYNTNATGPEEIAISILAKIIEVKNGGTGHSHMKKSISEFKKDLAL